MEEAKVKKIIVNSEHELTDLVDAIRSTDAENLIISFTEPSDLLVSPVGIEVLVEIADEEERSLIFQVLDNPAGTRNIVEAGAVYTDTTDEIPSELWEMAYTSMKNRKRDLTDSLKRTSSALSHRKETDDGTTVVDKTEVTETAEEQLNAKTDEDDGSNLETLEADEITDPMTKKELERSEFQQRIDRVLQKSKEEIATGKGKMVTHGGLAIALDHDISAEEIEEVNKEKSSNEPLIEDNSMFDTIKQTESANKKVTFDKQDKLDLTGKDLMNRNRSGLTEDRSIPITGFPKRSSMNNKGVSASGSANKTLPESIQKLVTRFKTLLGSKRFRKFGLILVVPIVLIAIATAYAIYTYTPLVKVNIYIESRPVAAERTFTGDTSVTNFDLENSKVPVKKETLKKERSDSTAATGQASRGEKATGQVRFLCGPIDGEFDVPKTILAGTTLTTNDGLQYVLISDVSFTCPSADFPTGTAEAAEFGADYNISSGKTLEIQGESDVAATTETSFTGGFEEEYTVISQADFDRVVNPLKESAFNEAEAELKRMESDGWVLVQNSVKSELDGQVLTDLPVSAEADILNVTVKTVSTALFYKRQDVESVAEELLIQVAQEEDLFNTENELDLQLSKDINSEVNVTKIEGDQITVVLTVSGSVKPEVNKNDILDNLKGKDLTEGAKYLESLSFVAKKTEISFKPDYFPVNLRYFPTRQGRILLNVKDVEPEVTDEVPQ